MPIACRVYNGESLLWSEQGKAAGGCNPNTPTHGLRGARHHENSRQFLDNESNPPARPELHDTTSALAA